MPVLFVYDRNAFGPLHSTVFTEELLEAHEAEAKRMKEYYSLHSDLFKKVSQRQEVWNKFMELERRAKDPSRSVCILSIREDSDPDPTSPFCSKPENKICLQFFSSRKYQIHTGTVFFNLALFC